MPFKSEAQRQWAVKQVEAGKMTQAQFEEWERDTPKKLPERVGPAREGSLKAPLGEMASYTKKRFGL